MVYICEFYYNKFQVQLGESMGACATVNRPAQDPNNPQNKQAQQEQTAKQIGFSLFKEVAKFGVGEGLKKLGVSENPAIKYGMDFGADVIQNVGEAVISKGKAESEQEKMKVRQQQQRIRLNALQPQNDANQAHINLQNRLQRSQIENVNPSNLAREPKSQLNNQQPSNLMYSPSWLRGESNTPLVPQVRSQIQKGVISSKLSDLQQKVQKQPSPYLLTSIIENSSEKEVLSRITNKNEREISTLKQTYMPTQLNPQHALNKLQQSKLMGSFEGISQIAGFNQDVIHDQGNAPIKGNIVWQSKIRIV